MTVELSAFEEDVPEGHALVTRAAFEEVDERTRVFSDIVRSRFATRAYLPTPVQRPLIAGALADALCAPSNCNTQPWRVSVVSGGARARLSDALVNERASGDASADFPFVSAEYPEMFSARISDNGRRIYEPQGVSRTDREGRARAAMNNLRFYGAPHVAIVRTWEVGALVHVAEDIGMFAQTFMLALAARGIASIPQTSVAQHAGCIRHELGLPPEERVLLAISFGYASEENAVNRVRSPRLIPEEVVTYAD